MSVFLNTFKTGPAVSCAAVLLSYRLSLSTSAIVCLHRLVFEMTCRCCVSDANDTVYWRWIGISHSPHTSAVADASKQTPWHSSDPTNHGNPRLHIHT